MRLESGRVRLEPMKPRHTELVVRWRSDPSVITQMFSDSAPTPEEHARWLRRIRREGTRREFVIVLREDDQPIGTIGLAGIDPVHRRAEYGILIGERAAQGIGYAREASEILLAHAFGDLHLHRVFLQVFERNRRAVALYERLGFRREGVLREAAWKRGRPVDIVVMAILRPEWIARRGDRVRS